MITSLTIDGIATYVNSPQQLSDLAEFNYFYGPNGSGKTTISRTIDDCSCHPDCKVTWRNGRELETLVYNRDFIDRVFNEADDLPGIFSLGEESAQLLADIEDAKTMVDRLIDERDGLRKTLQGEDGTGGKQGELVAAKETLRDACWLKKDNLGASCRDAFRGFLNDKAKFLEEVLRRAGDNKPALQTKEYLQERGGTVFGDPPQAVAQLQELAYDELSKLKEPVILTKPVIGRKDVDIASLIEKLGNSDWVKQGRKFLEISDDKCPFCQQVAPTSLEESLNEYFDESYANDLAAIEDLQTDYNREADAVVAAIDLILTNPPEQLDARTLKIKRDTLDAKLTTNRAHIAKKKEKPSTVVSLEEVDSLLRELAALVKTATGAIAQHNALVRGLAKEKSTLTAECWRYLIDVELKAELTAYEKKKETVGKAIESLGQQVRSKNNEINTAKNKLDDLQRQTTSVEPTITAINGVLRSFGFDGFSIAEAETPHCYKLVRADGTDARATLSEGERSFITFLYFYNLLQGSHEESGVMNDRVVVFDDPVSSLDSDVLFIVSTLIKRLKEEVRSYAGTVKQIFLLTHNVYFHKEATFDARRQGIAMNEETFWTVRKRDGCSTITRHDTNPIKTGYDLLWSEIRDDPRSTVATQNAMRRILEHYFKILGDKDPLIICDEFTGPDQLICKSLLSWVNDGSHHATDDLYVTVDQETIDTYQRVFRTIFENTGHLGHYDMMMGTPPTVAVPVPAGGATESRETEEAATLPNRPR